MLPSRSKMRSAFQFTRPRGARLVPRRQDHDGGHVSIHAPTGGATLKRFAAQQDAMLARFNSRAHGGRDTRRNPRRRPCGFQFTRPRGARPPPMLNHLHRDLFQFTRPRGARPNRRLGSSRRMCFNSRAHGGRDTAPIPTDCAFAAFQFTRPRGARPSQSQRCSPVISFNSRAHGGRDSTAIAYKLWRFVSIHAPTGGATRSD